MSLFGRMSVAKSWDVFCKGKSAHDNMIDSPGCGGLGVLLTADYQNLAISVESISAGYTALGWEEERSLCWQDFLQLLKQCCDVGYNEEDVCLGNVVLGLSLIHI